MAHRVVYDQPPLIDAEAIALDEGATIVRWTPVYTIHPTQRWVFAAGQRRK